MAFTVGSRVILFQNGRPLDISASTAQQAVEVVRGYRQQLIDEIEIQQAEVAQLDELISSYPWE